MAPAQDSRTASLSRLYEIVAYLLAFGVLINAMIAGRATFLNEWDIEVHGMIGNVLFLLAVAAFVITLVGRFRRPAIIGTGVLALLVFAQVGLGYSGRESAAAVAWHIPNGVLIMGLAMWSAAHSSLNRRR